MPHQRNRGLAAHADEGEPFEPAFLGLVERHRVGRVGVAAAGAPKTSSRLVATIGKAFHPGSPFSAFHPEVNVVDDVVLEQPDQHCQTRPSWPVS